MLNTVVPSAINSTAMASGTDASFLLEGVTAAYGAFAAAVQRQVISRASLQRSFAAAFARLAAQRALTQK